MTTSGATGSEAKVPDFRRRSAPFSKQGRTHVPSSSPERRVEACTAVAAQDCVGDVDGWARLPKASRIAPRSAPKSRGGSVAPHSENTRVSADVPDRRKAQHEQNDWAAPQCVRWLPWRRPALHAEPNGSRSLRRASRPSRAVRPTRSASSEGDSRAGPDCVATAVL